MMGDNEVLEIQNLSEDDLLELFQMLNDHIQYLNSNLIDNTVEAEGGEPSDG